MHGFYLKCLYEINANLIIGTLNNYIKLEFKKTFFIKEKMFCEKNVQSMKKIKSLKYSICHFMFIL